ncbi:sodium:proton symporter [Burkholderia glumae]|nr:sodium:proton symporter [Burkholderia glumae AU6208]PNL03124.1 sodium:proton symporter [Burkholderia glumae]QGA37848.1 sodium:proton symporter [Burkholderia glumae]QHP89791.1 sodium:proton symporter [Burkholderia glumae]RQZ69817.1 sodium:proton symporter [Burkholderia glumae]
MLLACGEFGHGRTVWIDSDLYFYTVVGEIQALLQVRRYRVDSAAIERRRNGGFDAATVRRTVLTTFSYKRIRNDYF